MKVVFSLMMLYSLSGCSAIAPLASALPLGEGSNDGVSVDVGDVAAVQQKDYIIGQKSGIETDDVDTFNQGNSHVTGGSVVINESSLENSAIFWAVFNVGLGFTSGIILLFAYRRGLSLGIKMKQN